MVESFVETVEMTEARSWWQQRQRMSGDDYIKAFNGGGSSLSSPNHQARGVNRESGITESSVERVKAKDWLKVGTTRASVTN